MPKISKEEAEKYLDAEPIKLGGNAIDLTGQKFGRLIVLKPVGKNKWGNIINLCLCDNCGEYTIVDSGDLKSGRTTSCGCLQKEISSSIAKDPNVRKKMVDSLRKAKNGNSLAEKCPKSIELWDYEQNYPKTPFDVNYGSNDKYHFKCIDYNHTLYMSCEKFYNGQRCKYCCGQAILIGFNDLLTSHPKLCEEWNYEKNKLGPKNYTAGSGIKVWWICKKCGNEWKAIIQSRTKGNGCKKCASSKGEKIIKEYLKTKQIEYIQQKSFNECRNKLPLPFDFYLPQYNLLIEFQGEQHYEIATWWYKTKQEAEEALKETKNHDKIKRDFCKSKKIKFLAIPYTYYDKIENILNEFFETNKLPKLKKPSIKTQDNIATNQSILEKT